MDNKQNRPIRWTDAIDQDCGPVHQISPLKDHFERDTGDTFYPFMVIKYDPSVFHLSFPPILSRETKSQCAASCLDRTNPFLIRSTYPDSSLSQNVPCRRPTSQGQSPCFLTFAIFFLLPSLSVPANALHAGFTAFRILISLSVLRCLQRPSCIGCTA